MQNKQYCLYSNSRWITWCSFNALLLDYLIFFIFISTYLSIKYDMLIFYELLLWLPTFNWQRLWMFLKIGLKKNCFICIILKKQLSYWVNHELWILAVLWMYHQGWTNFIKHSIILTNIEEYLLLIIILVQYWTF